MPEELTFIEHIYILRRKIFYSFFFFILFSILSYIFFPRFIGYIHRTFEMKLYVTKVYEGFVIRVQVAAYIGILMAMPILIFNLLHYIIPAFEKKDKILFTILFLFSLLLYAVAIYSVKVFLPISITFLESRSFIPDSLNKIFSYNEFISFFFKFMIAFCLTLQFPIILLILLYFNILKRSWLIRFIPYFIPVSLLLSAIVTQDLLSQFIVAVPMFLLYLICIFTAKILKWG